ncbi:MAG: pyruvate flavodoxin/ferredoxin oxidoreductase domain protein [Chloroflexi bacterium]|nr:pyruvate flavodoxin/ferredoxin oxidoreductase domain protein [Chloroflexota bacterium]
MAVVVNNVTFKIGGEAGQGSESSGAGFTKAFARAGLFVYGLQDYMSRIRGGHNFFQIRVSDRDIQATDSGVQVLLPLDIQTVEAHLHEVVPGGAVIMDAALKIDDGRLTDRGVKPIRVPLTEIAQREGGNILIAADFAPPTVAATVKLMVNTAAVAVAAGMTDLPFEYIEQIIRENFGGKKGAAIADANVAVARAAYEEGSREFGADFGWKVKPILSNPRMVINGNQAIAFGAAAAGCRWISMYPMTPATTVSEWLAAHSRKLGIVVKQCEDEITAILMAIGAAHTGVRAMTSTSGGGLSLMVEAVGLAAMTETPLVVVLAQRGGPSTGLPTRTEQSDLQFVLHASQGEFPRVILAPGTLEECFLAGYRAFNFAEKYQTPVFILTDMNQSTAVRAVDPERFNVRPEPIDRGELLTDADLDVLTEPYLRHKITPSGISPRALPGHKNAVVLTTSDEHYENGQAVEEAEMRVLQMDKRMRKADMAARDIRPPLLEGPQDAELTLVGWGSTYGPIHEARLLLEAEGLHVNHLHYFDIWPFPKEATERILGSARRAIDIENNYTAQLALVIRMVTGIDFKHKILKYDGRPFSGDELAQKVREGVLARV